MEKIDWELYGWVARGIQRRKVLVAMNKPKIPTEIKRDTELSITHVSKALKSFVDKGIAICVTPAMKTGKIFTLTERGEAIREEMVRGIS